MPVRRLLATSLVVASAWSATPAFAQYATEPPSDIIVSGYVQGVTDYRFRGISRSDGDVAVQGSINVDHASGFYVGAWASSLHDTPVRGQAEVDLYAGWSGEVASGLTADGGLLYYAFPDGDVGDASIWEPYASLTASLGPATAKVGIKYAWDQDSLGGGDNLYLYTDLGASVPNMPVSLTAHLGYTDGALSPKRLTGSGTGGGFDWSLGASYSIVRNLSVGASYVGVEGRSIDGFSNDTLVGTLKFAF